MMENLSKLTRLQNDRHLGRHSTDSVRSPLVLADTTGRHSPDTRPTSRRYLTDILDLHLGRYSTKYRSISCPRVGRDVGRVSAKISAECRPICRPIAGRSTIDRHYRFIGLRSADTSTIMLRWAVGGISVHCRWYMGRHLVVYCVLLTVCFAEIFWNVSLLLPRVVSSTGRHYWLTLARYSTNISADTWPTYSTDISADTPPSIGR